MTIATKGTATPNLSRELLQEWAKLSVNEKRAFLDGYQIAAREGGVRP